MYILFRKKNQKKKTKKKTKKKKHKKHIKPEKESKGNGVCCGKANILQYM